MPEDGVSLTPTPNLLTNKEIIHIASLFVKLGVDKIRFTGGEPLIRKDIVEIIRDISKLKTLNTIALTTNGLILHKKIENLKEAGVNALNISLDTLVPSKFEFITRRKGFSHVMKSIEAAIDLDFTPLKINCVVIKGVNDDELGEFVQFTKDKNINVRFIEYCPFTGNKWNFNKMVPYLEMLNIIRQMYPELIRLPDHPNDTSKAYKVPGFAGQIGFITSMTENFCNSCNRLRITADGNLKICLFGKEEISIRDALRQNISEEELVNIISSAVLSKKKQHAEKVSNISVCFYSIKTFDNYLSNMRDRMYIYYKLKILQHFQLNCIPFRYCSQFTHVTQEGQINMVDVSSKFNTIRYAEAEARIFLGATAFNLLLQNQIKKGDVLSVANIAGILAAKRTSELIPLCHLIRIDQIKLNFELLSDQYEILIKSTVKTIDRTGAEMEALTSATVAALTIYDMCKAVSKEMIIKSIQLTLKTGGKEDYIKA